MNPPSLRAAVRRPASPRTPTLHAEQPDPAPPRSGESIDPAGPAVPFSPTDVRRPQAAVPVGAGSSTPARASAAGKGSPRSSRSRRSRSRSSAEASWLRRHPVLSVRHTTEDEDRLILTVVAVACLTYLARLAQWPGWWGRPMRLDARPDTGARSVPHRGERSEWGQATAEYALVLLGVAAIALLLAAWAARSGKLAELFDAVIDQLISKAR